MTLSCPIQILGHTTYTTERNFDQLGMGEIAHAAKFHAVLKAAGYSLSPIADIYQLFDGKELVDRYASLNMELARQGYPISDTLPLPSAFLPVDPTALHLILSYEHMQAALLGLGLYKRAPTVAKFYRPHLKLPLLPAIYAPCDLIVTECLGANIAGAAAGVPPWKMLYLPHTLPPQSKEFTLDKRLYLEELAQRQGRELKVTDETVVVAYVARFRQGKNIEYALRAFDAIAAKAPHALFLLKGGYGGQVGGTLAFRERFDPLLERYKKKPWFLWDDSWTPLDQTAALYRCFDLYLHPSGIDYASNTVAEVMALGVPCLVLQEHTNPYLFGGGVEFAPAHPKAQFWGKFAYRVPNVRRWAGQLLTLLRNPDRRAALGARGKEVALSRFGNEALLQRIPLLIDAALSFHRRTGRQEELKERLMAQYRSDLEEYGL